LAWPTIASKNWVYRQYDHSVRDNTIVAPGAMRRCCASKRIQFPAVWSAVTSSPLSATGDSSPAIVGQVPQSKSADKSAHSTDKFIAISVDCNAAYVYLDPYVRWKIAVAEACRNLACSGAVPLGATDNLNFGNPHNPEIFFQLKESVRGLAEACKHFNAPVTGGNCSLYNQSPNGPIDPTPTVAVVGIIEKSEHITTQWFKDEGDVIILLGDIVDRTDPLQGLGGSAYLQQTHDGRPEHRRELIWRKRRPAGCVARLDHTGRHQSAHDCSEGGLAVALAECCISQQVARETPRLIGASIDLSTITVSREGAADQPEDKNAVLSRDAAAVRIDALLFGETQSGFSSQRIRRTPRRFLVRTKNSRDSCSADRQSGGTELKITMAQGDFSWAVAELHDAWWNSIARAMK
jgi:phosphoribosylformylglycinamidine synthase